ncbi:hypothetical protein ACVXHA_25340 [Escherichia coli]
MIDLTAPKTNPNSARTQSWRILANAKAAAAAKGMPLYEHIAELNRTPAQILYAGSDDEHHQRW